MLTAHILQMYYQSLLLLYITVEQVFPAQWREAILGQTGSRAVMAEGAIICAPEGEDTLVEPNQRDGIRALALGTSCWNLMCSCRALAVCCSAYGHEIIGETRPTHLISACAGPQGRTVERTVNAQWNASRRKRRTTSLIKAALTLPASSGPDV